ncbi:MAG: CPBP family intramembrane metalloprotease [Candidatus Aminicenantes bacterium]|nr:CPBP family intramembrane metalloprotease [Candidatus Aminicenantes bacterium]
MILFRNHQERSSLWNNLKRKPLKKAGLGFFTAFFLYVIFYLGYEIILKLWPEGNEQIRQIYNFKANVSEWRLFILLSFLIGPGEEIVWRWFLQQRWGELIGQKASFLIVTAIYSLVHLPTGNSLLILAAFICGLFWGWLFWQNNSLLLNIVSHSLWDVFIFVLWPLI